MYFLVSFSNFAEGNSRRGVSRLKWQQTCHVFHVAPGRLWSLCEHQEKVQVPGPGTPLADLCHTWVLHLGPCSFFCSPTASLSISWVFVKERSLWKLKPMSKSPFPCLKLSPSPGGNSLCPQYFNSLISFKSMENKNWWARFCHSSTSCERITLGKLQNRKQILFHKMDTASL